MFDQTALSLGVLKPAVSQTEHVIDDLPARRSASLTLVADLKEHIGAMMLENARHSLQDVMFSAFGIDFDQGWFQATACREGVERNGRHLVGCRRRPRAYLSLKTATVDAVEGGEGHAKVAKHHCGVAQEGGGVVHLNVRATSRIVLQDPEGAGRGLERVHLTAWPSEP